jgi:peptidoglycan/LPS O-acetylase OafA/YrhL
MKTISEQLRMNHGRGPSFDLIRLIAAILVVYAHSFLVVGQRDNAWQLLFPGVDSGTFAVSIFFAASGYMITESLRRNPAWNIFLYKRALRIYPALIVVVVVTTYVIGIVFSTKSAGQYIRDGHVILYLVSAIFPLSQTIPSVFSDGSSHYINGSLWTLRYEIICYLALAMFGKAIFINRKLSIVILSMSILSCIIVALFPDELREVKVFATISQAVPLFAYFAGGVVISVFSDRIVIRPLLLVIAGIVVLIGMRSPYFSVLFPLFGAYVVVALGLLSALRVTRLENSPMWAMFLTERILLRSLYNRSLREQLEVIGSIIS